MSRNTYRRERTADRNRTAAMNLKSLLSILLMGLSAQAATIIATVPRASYTAGSTIPVEISVTKVTDLYAFQIDISFNPAVLEAQSIAEGGYFLSNGISFLPGTVNNSAGTISLLGDSLSGPGPGFTGNTLLATATFTALAPRSTSISPINLVLLDSNLSDITAGASIASVMISGGIATPEPSFLGVVSGLACLGFIAFRKRLAADVI